MVETVVAVINEGGVFSGICNCYLYIPQNQERQHKQIIIALNHIS